MKYVIRFIDMPAYFERFAGEYCYITFSKDSAMRFDSILDANNYREHRIALQETIIEEYSPAAP